VFFTDRCRGARLSKPHTPCRNLRVALGVPEESSDQLDMFSACRSRHTFRPPRRAVSWPSPRRQAGRGRGASRHTSDARRAARPGAAACAPVEGRSRNSRSVKAVSIATSDLRCPPRVPPRRGSQPTMASGANQRVTSPRRTSARSIGWPVATLYRVLLFGMHLRRHCGAVSPRARVGFGSRSIERRFLHQRPRNARDRAGPPVARAGSRTPSGTCSPSS
jgi:hypothetical protein